MSNEAALPPGVSAADFAAAAAEFRRILGDEHVIVEPQRLRPYTQLMVPIEEEKLMPAGALAPATLEQVQAVLAVCNRYRVPVWPISTGRNFAYGSAAPGSRGQVVLDLRRMNRILHVDAELGTVLVEPGVTYQQLYDHFKENNIPFWLDLPGPGPMVGPVGNSLERGNGYTPYGDHFANVCGLEVVLADGSVLRTGMGSVENSKSWQTFKYGYGPYLDGLFSQSNFAVVTKMGVWLMPKPAGYKTVLVQYWNDDDVGIAVDTIRPLRLSGVIPNVGLLVDAASFVSDQVTRKEIYQGPGAVPLEVMLAAGKARGFAPWSVVFTLYGNDEQIAANYKIAATAFEKSGGRVIPNIYDPLQVGEPDMGAMRLMNWVGGGGSTFFNPITPMRGRDVLKQRDLSRKVLSKHGFDTIAAFTLNVRDMHHLIALQFNAGVAEEVQRARECFLELLSEFAREGYSIYRAPLGFMDEVADVYGPAKRQFNQRLKRALDPNGILAPGKCGIYV